jgi:hypothetical protein
LHVPLTQAFPLLHGELPPQHGSPLLPQCWHVLPEPKGLCAQTF